MPIQQLRNVLLTWFIFVFVAILNGALRNFVYKPYVGDLAAHQISTIVGIIAFILLANFMFKDSLADAPARQLFLIGFIWTIMTIFFEFVAGHYLFGNSWEKLFADYNLLKGRIWILVLLFELVTPFVLKIFHK